MSSNINCNERQKFHKLSNCPKIIYNVNHARQVLKIFVFYQEKLIICAPIFIKMCPLLFLLCVLPFFMLQSDPCFRRLSYSVIQAICNKIRQNTWRFIIIWLLIYLSHVFTIFQHLKSHEPKKYLFYAPTLKIDHLEKKKSI